ncbi:hypothetical protein KY290_024816 [Solanum tuberosum]|uniref:DUF4283 domain-containing protein n=1 Tax=Solanum tuberosum TaxID=4113 RepID=A0ABQ7URQ3_SOLTU|nr:hypothetical protein KY284_023671 [Solanum tuberosum]KAH0754546.1 hypothetical protein KY290_024816 [Solanum tuberosum]
MRTLKWDPMFNPEEETTIAIAWISFPALPPNFFGREVVFSLAVAVGKPLQVDMVTRNQTRPSCARMKVEVDLLGEFPKRIKIGMKKASGEGHDEQQCYVEHPKLYLKKENSDQEPRDKKKRQPEQVGAKVNIPTGNQLGALETDEKDVEDENKNIGGGGEDYQIVDKQISKEWIENSFGKLDATAGVQRSCNVKDKGSNLHTSEGGEKQVDVSSKLDKSPNNVIQQSHNIKEKASNMQSPCKSLEHVEVSSRMEESPKIVQSSNGQASGKNQPHVIRML